MNWKGRFYLNFDTKGEGMHWPTKGSIYSVLHTVYPTGLLGFPYLSSRESHQKKDVLNRVGGESLFGCFVHALVTWKEYTIVGLCDTTYSMDFDHHTW